MRGALAYDAPETLAEIVGSFEGRRFDAAIDIGCGTGLAGEAFRFRCRRLIGCDLSARMLERAAQRRLYDALIHTGLMTALEERPGAFDLVICCDVLIYIGNLAPVFAAVARALRPGGSFAFTVETGEADTGFDLRPFLRYTHSERFLRRLASANGFVVEAIRSTTLRVEGDEAVAGQALHMVLAPP